MIKKIIGSLLAVCMMVSVGSTVFAGEVEGDYVADGMVLAGSYTEQTDDGYVKKELFVNPESLMKGFSGTLYGTAVNSVYSNGGRTLEFKVVANASFTSQYDTDIIYLVSGTYGVVQYGNWKPYNFSEDRESNAGIWGTKYAKYTVNYDHSNGTTGSAGRAYIKCDALGNMSDSTGNYGRMISNQVIVGDTVISF